MPARQPQHRQVKGCARPPPALHLPAPCPGTGRWTKTALTLLTSLLLSRHQWFFFVFFLSPASPWAEVDNELCIWHWHSQWGEITNYNSTSSLPISLGGWNNGDAYIFFSTFLRQKINKPLCICFSWKQYVWINQHFPGSTVIPLWVLNTRSFQKPITKL